MSHLYSVSKSGDQLCPLGFHPQVRWPTRCKRCFRDYKEHGARRGDEIANSTPSLNKDCFEKSIRSWTSTSNLSSQTDSNIIEVTAPLRIRQRPSSWSSTPDLDDTKKSANQSKSSNEEIVVNVQIPVRRRNTTNLDSVEESFTLKRQTHQASSQLSSAPVSQPKLTIKTIPQKSVEKNEEVTINKTDSLAERVRKMQLIKRQGSVEREIVSTKNDSTQSSGISQDQTNESIRQRRSRDSTNLSEKQSIRTRADQLPPVPAKSFRSDLHSVSETKNNSLKKPMPVAKTLSDSYMGSNRDIQFLIQLKDNKDNDRATLNQINDSDDASVTTNTTETTLVYQKTSELSEENEKLKRELESVKARCERAERDKSDILLRRLATIDTTSNRSAASEAFKLQQKVNEMKQKIEGLEQDKKDLSQKLKESLEKSKIQSSKSLEEALRSKLEQAEKMCEALMDENEEMKKDLKNMESEMDELQDNFREEQADEYVSVKKELEQTTKNCRILSFKLKKSERKIEQLEQEMQSKGTQSSSEMTTRIKQLEDELRVANEVARRLQIESEQNQTSNKKTPSLSKIGKSNSDSGGKFSRASLTRGGSQEDPVQLLRDLQDSAEREADLREQLKFAEEEAESLRKKSSRVEEENESLVMQLKKMASKSRARKLSPSILKRNDIEKDEGISDEEDTAELKLQLELNEQETAVLRRKVEELEKESEFSKRQIEQLHEKLASQKVTKTSLLEQKKENINDPLTKKKINVLEDEINELRKKLIDKDRELERIQTEASLSKVIKTKTQRAKSTQDVAMEAQNIDLKHQLQVVEQEANILRTKTQSLEQENDKLLAEIKKLQLQSARKSLKGSNNKEYDSSKANLEELQKEHEFLKSKLKMIESESTVLPERTPKVYSDTKTKLQLKKMIEELEDEVVETRALISKNISSQIKSLEESNRKLTEELNASKKHYDQIITEMKSTKNLNQVKDLETKLQKIETENIKKIKTLEDNLLKREQQNKTLEALTASIDQQLKSGVEKTRKIETELEDAKSDRDKWESKLRQAENDFTKSTKIANIKIKELEKEIDVLKGKLKVEIPSKRFQEIQDEKKELEESLSKETKKANQLKCQYELLEEEHVLIKAQLTTDKEKLESEIKALSSKIKQFENNELINKNEKDELLKKISTMQRKITEFEHSSSLKTSKTTNDLEINRLKIKLEEKESEYEKLRKQHDMVTDQLSNYRKENEDIKRKLDDFERINKAQRTLNDHNLTLENELRKLKTKLEASEMAVKAEVASTRLRYETQLNTLQNELTSVHRQCERYKKDKDSFKQLLEAAQKNIGELKQNRRSYVSTSSGDEDDKSKIHSLEQQVGCLEDELSESRLDASKLRTEMISEKSAFEIKVSEMQSKLNEYEEERILNSSKVPGTKTRLELSWQKEREEQQRLLSETATLARDLRQTLFEVERERDKERLESKRKVDLIKKATEEELEEGRRKISELQSDLLELRDAHAKLRTANEKLRRDKDRFERDRDINTNSNKRKLEQLGERKVGLLLQTVDELMRMAPDLQSISKGNVDSSQTALSIPNPKVERSKSRSVSPAPTSTTNVSTVLARLAEASDELRRYQRLYDEEKEREKVRRSGMRRATSQEHENVLEVNTSRPIARLNRASHGSLYRKSLSLDQSIQVEQQQIWKDSDVGSMSSVQSIDSEYGIRRGDSSFDSRISIGSTQSDMPNRRKKKKGIIGKLRSLTKSNRGTESDVSQQLSDSDLSLTGADIRSSKKDLKERISGMFKRSGSTSRAGSQEKNINDSQQRPVSITASLPQNSTLPQNFKPQESPNLSKNKPPASQKPKVKAKLKN